MEFVLPERLKRTPLVDRPAVLGRLFARFAG
jgi:hypothetical protein